MSDDFGSASTRLDSPASSAVAITPSDTVDLANVTRAIYVGTGGDLTVIMRGGQSVTFTAVPQGVMLSVRASRVLATGTTATNLVGVW
jgi:hypothetical protein